MLVWISDFSYPRPFVPENERSLWRTFVPYGELSFPRNESSRNFRSRDLSFPGNFVLRERKFLGTFVPGTFRSHNPIGLVTALLCVCLITDCSAVTSPLWCWLHCLSVCLWCAYNSVTAHKTLEVGLTSVSLSTGIITFIHFASLFNRKKTRAHLKLTQFIFGKQTLLGLLRNKFWQLL